MIWLIRHASYVVSVDSGPMHIAAAITDRLLSVHTWSDPRLVGPRNPRSWIWKSGRIFPMRDEPNNRNLPTSEVTVEDARKMTKHVRAALRERRMQPSERS
jgi:heptosyltransferase-1